MPTETTIATGNPEIDGILSPYRYTTSEDGMTYITWSIPPNVSAYSNYTDAHPEPATFEPWEDREAFENTLGMIARITNIIFEEVGAEGDYQGDVRIAYSNAYNGISHAGMPYGEWTVDASDIWMEGTNNFGLLLHELGHALGLSHPHDAWPTNQGYWVDLPLLPAELDHTEYTMMSYSASGRFPGTVASDPMPQTLMYGDILALQALYGVNTTATAGDDVYVFDQTSKHFSTIWDYGGNDTIKIVGDHYVEIDLTPDSWNNVGTVLRLYYETGSSRWIWDSVYITPDTTIENATGSEGNDSLRGNDANNVLRGRSGDDELRGEIGNDSLWGGDGNDKLYGSDGDDHAGGGTGDDLIETGDGRDFAYGFDGNDTIDGGAGNDVLWAGSGDDSVAGDSGNDRIGLRDGNDIVHCGTGNDTVYGAAGDDTIYGDGGQDLLFGGSGNDCIYSGTGNDTVYGGAGDDILSGGAGADIFVFSSNSGDDTITDFNIGEDSLDLRSVGYGPTLTATSEGMLISWNDASIFLDGVFITNISEIDLLL